MKNEEMVSTKKSLHRELIKNLGLERKISHLTKVGKQLEGRNQRLTAVIGSKHNENVEIIDSILYFETQEERNEVRQEIMELGR